ncbi:MAG: type II toxin-antitoxin system VapC family toxin [Chloroflexota bacterium]|nr:type II toxin-antitoxin system VapC family toxin [Chloroflexota bacterium]
MGTTPNGPIADASIVAKWYLRDEDLIAEADRLYADWNAGRWNVVPGNFPFEVVHAVHHARRRQRLTPPVADTATADFTALLGAMTFVEPRFIVQHGARLATDLGVNFFDACYLRIARMTGYSYITADAAFYRQTQSQPGVRWLGNY